MKFNAIIAGVAGGAAGAVTMLGTVSAVQPTASPVPDQELYTYADE